MNTENFAVPRYSLVIPAYNEADLLPATLDKAFAAVAAQAIPGEVVVVDNNSTDATGQIAAEAGARVVFEAKNQIARARNAGAATCQTDYLVFLDADTLIEPQLLSQALANLEDSLVCGGGAAVAFSESVSPQSQRLVEFWNRYAKRSGTAAGSFLYCRRTDFEAVGGFCEAMFAGEELALSRALRRLGKSRGQRMVVIDPPRVKTSARKLDWYSAWTLYLTAALLLLFPFALRSRRLCWLWYHRPASSESRDPAS